MPPEPTFPCNGHSELRQLSFFTSRDLVDERTASSKIGLKLYHARRLGAGRQHLIAEAPVGPPGLEPTLIFVPHSRTWPLTEPRDAAPRAVDRTGVPTIDLGFFPQNNNVRLA